MGEELTGELAMGKLAVVRLFGYDVTGANGWLFWNAGCGVGVLFGDNCGVVVPLGEVGKLGVAVGIWILAEGFALDETGTPDETGLVKRFPLCVAMPGLYD